MGQVASLPTPQLKGHIWFAEDVRRMLVLGLFLLTSSLQTNFFAYTKPVLCVFECVHVCACVCACMCVCVCVCVCVWWGYTYSPADKKTADIWKHSMVIFLKQTTMLRV